MRSRFARVGVLAGVLLGLFATVAPASADTYKTVSLVGNAILTGCTGLGYPVHSGTPSTTVTVKPGPKPGTSTVNLAPGGTTCNFALTAICVKTSAGKKTVPNDTCVIEANGQVEGYCGLSTGQGAAVVSSDTKTPQIQTEFKFTGVGGVLSVTGGNEETNIVGEVAAIPTTGTCATTTATGFTVAGEIVYKDCTGPTIAGVCTVP